MNKNVNILLLSIFVVFFILSCKDKDKLGEKHEKEVIYKAENFTELIDKYKGEKFTNCEDFFNAKFEMMDIYAKTINKAYSGNAEAKQEIEKIEDFMSKFDIQAKLIKKKCPDEYLKFKIKMDNRINEFSDKLIEIYTVMEFDVEWDKTLESLEEEINQNLENIETKIMEAKKEEKQIEDEEGNDSIP